MTNRPHYHLTLDGLPDDVPGDIRLRQLIKVALRSFRFRAKEIRPADNVGSDEARPLPVGPSISPQREGQLSRDSGCQ
jgi:hypothetical protein